MATSNFDFECRSSSNTIQLVAVLPWGRTLPVRVTWSDKGRSKRWLDKIPQLPKALFLLDAPNNSRKVFDTDGSTGEVVLDDLYDVEGWDTNHMCSIYSIPQNQHFHIQKIESPLRAQIPQKILFQPVFMGCLALGGMWGIRKNDQNQTQSILWVSESKWKKNILNTQNLIEAHSSAYGGN